MKDVAGGRLDLEEEKIPVCRHCGTRNALVDFPPDELHRMCLEAGAPCGYDEKAIALLCAPTNLSNRRAVLNMLRAEAHAFLLKEPREHVHDATCPYAPRCKKYGTAKKICRAPRDGGGIIRFRSGMGMHCTPHLNFADGHLKDMGPIGEPEPGLEAPERPARFGEKHLLEKPRVFFKPPACEYAWWCKHYKPNGLLCNAPRSPERWVRLGRLAIGCTPNTHYQDRDNPEFAAAIAAGTTATSWGTEAEEAGPLFHCDQAGDCEFAGSDDGDCFIGCEDVQLSCSCGKLKLKRWNLHWVICRGVQELTRFSGRRECPDCHSVFTCHDNRPKVEHATKEAVAAK